MSAAGVAASTVPGLGLGRGSIPTAALRDMAVRPVPAGVARKMVESHHYLHSLPGGTKLSFGVFVGTRLLGAVTLGVGPFNGCSLVEGATLEDCLTLTRLWLSDELPRNSESRVISTVQRKMRRHTSVRFLLSYADPSRGHVGTIYQAANWLYTGLSEPTPLYDLGDGVGRHNRSVAHTLGTRSVSHLASHGVEVKLVPQSPKHRYITFLDKSWRCRLKVPVLPYPKKEGAHK
jgi:hypothetical protein